MPLLPRCLFYWAERIYADQDTASLWDLEGEDKEEEEEEEGGGDRGGEQDEMGRLLMGAIQKQRYIMALSFQYMLAEKLQQNCSQTIS